jgi:hypothetical protein
VSGRPTGDPGKYEETEIAPEDHWDPPLTSGNSPAFIASAAGERRRNATVLSEAPGE